MWFNKRVPQTNQAARAVNGAKLPPIRHHHQVFGWCRCRSKVTAGMPSEEEEDDELTGFTPADRD